MLLAKKKRCRTFCEKPSDYGLACSRGLTSVHLTFRLWQYHVGSFRPRSRQCAASDPQRSTSRTMVAVRAASTKLLTHDFMNTRGVSSVFLRHFKRSLLNALALETTCTFIRAILLNSSLQRRARGNWTLLTGYLLRSKDFWMRTVSSSSFSVQLLTLAAFVTSLTERLTPPKSRFPLYLAQPAFLLQLRLPSSSRTLFLPVISTAVSVGRHYVDQRGASAVKATYVHSAVLIH